MYLFFEISERVRGKHKFQYAIETNHDQRIYLATYLWIDDLYGIIQIVHIFYRFWNYWHPPMKRCTAITIDYS